MKKSSQYRSSTSYVDDDGQDREYLVDGKDMLRHGQYKRDDAPTINDKEDNFCFMQIDCDYYTARADEMPRKCNRSLPRFSHNQSFI